MDPPRRAHYRWFRRVACPLASLHASLSRDCTTIGIAIMTRRLEDMRKPIRLDLLMGQVYMILAT